VATIPPNWELVDWTVGAGAPSHKLSRELADRTPRMDNGSCGYALEVTTLVKQPSWFSKKGMEARTKLVALGILKRELGLGRALRAGMAAERGGDPFADEGPPDCEEERLSRGQIGPAIQLYRALEGMVGRDEALRITGRVVHEAAVIFLGHTVGRLDPARWAGLDDEARRALVEAIQARFFNATADIEDVTATGFVMRVRSCRFVRLCAAAGCPEVAPLFCAGDLAFFNAGPVRLERPGTLAEGAADCEFRFGLEAE
jgi:hypothetical protein